MPNPFLPPLDSFGDEYPMMQELIRRAHEYEGDDRTTPVEVTRKEQTRLYDEITEWASTHGTDLAENPHRVSNWGAIQIEVTDD